MEPTAQVARLQEEAARLREQNHRLQVMLQDVARRMNGVLSCVSAVEHEQCGESLLEDSWCEDSGDDRASPTPTPSSPPPPSPLPSAFNPAPVAPLPAPTPSSAPASKAWRTHGAKRTSSSSGVRRGTAGPMSSAASSWVTESAAELVRRGSLGATDMGDGALAASGGGAETVASVPIESDGRASSKRSRASASCEELGKLVRKARSRSKSPKSQRRKQGRLKRDRSASAMNAHDSIVLTFTSETAHLQARMVQLIEGIVSMQPPQHRLTWFHGHCSIVKHGDGTFYPAEAAEPLCGTWENNEFVDYHHGHVAPSALEGHLNTYHKNVAERVASPPISPRERSLANDDEGNPMSMVKVVLKSEFDRMFADELRIFIFAFLDVQSLCRAAQVCTEWRRLTNDPTLWASIHLSRWGRLRACSNVDQKRKLRDGGIDWKEAVRDQHLLERNWTKGQYFMQTLRGHSGWVTGVDLHTNKLVSCSYDGTVRVWNTQTGNSLQTLPGELHGDDMLSPCWCVKFKGSQIMAGSSDSKVKQWDMNTAQLVRVFEGHAGGVKCLQFDDHANQLITGSDDKTVKIFDVRSGVCVQSIACAEAVGDFQCQGDTLMTVLKRESDVFWFDLRMGTLARQLSGHSKAFDLNRKMLVTGARDRKLFVWNTDTCEPVQELTGHDYTVMSLQFDTHKLVSASADETIKIWDLKSGNCMQTLTGHTEVVMKVSMDQTKIVSSSADKTVIVWDFLRGR